MKNYLIWDFDGTLAHRLGGWVGALLEVIHREAPACEVTADQLRPHLQAGFPWHTPEQPHPAITSADQWWYVLDPVFARAFMACGIDVQQARRMATQVRQVYPHPGHWRLYDDTIPALNQLSTQGWSHIILSNHVPELPAIIHHLQLGPYIGHIFNSAQTGYEKPHPQAFRHVLATFGDVGLVWMIGDSLQADVVGASMLGIRSILVRATHPDAQYCCRELAHVPALIDRTHAGGCPGAIGCESTRAVAPHPASYHSTGVRPGNTPKPRQERNKWTCATPSDRSSTTGRSPMSSDNI
jgi:putative hydrolase of the HAD superfamily